MKMNDHSEDIIRFTNEILSNYEKCKGRDVKLIQNFVFWDAVVLTTGDAVQQQVFELQLEAKRSRGELPTDVPFHVFSDLPNTKAGNGGATINSLAELHSIYEDKLSSMRILVIHAGGQSQRLPSASIMGKIFTALPIGSPVSDMLDLNLALFLPFLRNMQPGVFVTCADVIILYRFSDYTSWSFDTPGFTVLAHPSTIKIGVDHGVYVLKDAKAALQKNVGLFKCLKVLQKPSEEKMRNQGAVVSYDDKELVYTDSVFFFDHEITQKLLKFHNDCGPVTCEIDGYGDFLQALGPMANSDYIHNMANVSKVEPYLLEMRQKMFDLLKFLPLNTIVLNDSKFYHLGTMREYLENFGRDEFLSRALNFEKAAFVKLSEKHPIGDCGNFEGRILHSVLDKASVIQQKCVVEFCNFDVPVTIGEGSIISNCEYKPDAASNQGSFQGSGMNFDINMLEVPVRSLLHTVPINVGERTVFITVMCSTADNLKKLIPELEVDEEFSGILEATGRTVEQIFGEEKSFCLWRARIFPAMQTMSSSFLASLSILQVIAGATGSMPKFQIPDGTSWFSMADMMKMKNVSAMLEYRQSLHDVIKSH